MEKYEQLFITLSILPTKNSEWVMALKPNVAMAAKWPRRAREDDLREAFPHTWVSSNF